MKLKLAALLALTWGVAGCPIQLPTSDSPTDGNSLSPTSSENGDVNDVSSARDLPTIENGRVKIRIVNKATSAATVRTTMRIAGVQVHAATKQVPAARDDIVVGPDTADAVVVEATVLSEPPETLPIATYFLGRDFAAGDTIQYVIPAGTDPNDNGDSEQQAPPVEDPNDAPADPNDTPVDPGTLTVALADLDPGLVVNPGTPVSFGVVTSAFTSAATLTVSAARDDGVGDPIVVVDTAAVADSVDVVWDTTGVVPATYVLAARVTDGDRTAQSDMSTTKVRINAQPDLVFEHPVDGTVVTRGEGLLITWTATDADDDALVMVFIDRDGQAGTDDEQTLSEGISEDDAGDGELNLATDELELGTWFVGGQISDGLTTRLVYAGSFEIVAVPAPLSISIEGLEADQVVNAGTKVGFDLVMANFSAVARATVFADVDDDPTNGRVTVAEDVVAAERVAVSWDTSGLAPGTYRVYARVADGSTTADSGVAVGTVRINALPELVIVSPFEDTLLTRGRPLVVAWAGQDPDDEASITIFLDHDGVADSGDEVELAADVPASDVSQRDLELNTSGLAVGVYFIGGRITDQLTTINAYAGGTVSIEERLLGKFTPVELGASGLTPMTTVTPDGQNLGLGAAVDISGDLNGDGLADLIAGAPVDGLSGLRAGDGTAVDRVYYHTMADGNWPATLSASTASLTIEGETGSGTLGAALAILPSVDGDGVDDLLLGAPAYNSLDGRVYLLSGRPTLLQSSPFSLTKLAAPLGTRFTGSAELAGAAVAHIGDLDADGTPDYAYGSPNFSEPRNGYGSGGVVAAVRGGFVPPELYTTEIGWTTPGTLFVGPVGSRSGFAIGYVRDLNADKADELLIGAPGAAINNNASGAAYLVFGQPDFFDNYNGESSVVDLATSDNRIVLAGEVANDQAGAAVAHADFNGDGKDDLIIGAPGAGQFAGRVYVVFGLDELVETEASSPLLLANVGTAALPGVVLNGTNAGDLVGTRVLSGGDFDGDGREDLLIGAPGADDQRGAVYLVYGRDTTGDDPLTSRLDLADIAKPLLPGWRLTGDQPLRHLGTALSAGRLNNDGPADVAIGAPGYRDGLGAGVSGEIYLIFGRGNND